MKFRIRKEDGLYCAEYKSGFSWWYVKGSWSRTIEEARKACEEYKNMTSENNKIVEVFEL